MTFLITEYNRGNGIEDTFILTLDLPRFVM
jgi:hypothetical protein